MSLSYLLWIVVIILVISWVLGVGGVYSLGHGRENWIHIIIVIAVIVVIYQLVTRGRIGPP